MEDNLGFQTDREIKQFNEEVESSADSQINDLNILDKCKMMCQKSKICMRL